MKLIQKNKYLIGMIIMLIIGLGLSTYAWFNLRRNVNLTESYMTTTSYGGITVAPGKVTSGNFELTASFDPTPNYAKRDISSNGSSFLRWTGIKESGTGKPINFVNAQPNTDYIVQDFTFLSTATLDIYLARESKIINVPGKGSLAPASRAAFYEWDGNAYNLMFVWAPNTSQAADSIDYVTNTSGDLGDFTAVKTGLPSVDDNDIAAGTTGKVATLISDGTKRVRTIQIVLWLEGTDPAAIKTNLVNNVGQWQAEFKFVASKSTETEPLSTLAESVTTNSALTQPQLQPGMIPVKYVNDQWVKSSTKYKEWYNYDKQQWGNAVFVTAATRGNYLSAAVDTPINMGDVLGFLVWIPRYEYRINPTYGTALPELYGSTATQATPGAIEVRFISLAQTQPTSGYSINKAFRSGAVPQNGWGIGGWTTELAGFWVGKFETTGTTSDPTILPDQPSLRNQTLSAQYQKALSFSGDTHVSGLSITRGDTAKYGLTTKAHLIKNSEWGAVAYLSQSIFGKYGNSDFRYADKEIFSNPSSSYVTGRSGEVVSPSTLTDNANTGTSALYGYDGSSCVSKTNFTCTGAKNAKYGKAASTTGNIYGIYDMSGGAADNVMGNYNSTYASYPTVLTTGLSSGFTTLYYPPSNYIDYYYSSDLVCGNYGSCYGHALSETSGWYGDSAAYVNSSNPWFNRGAGANRGIFGYQQHIGDGAVNVGWRLAVS